MRYLLSIGAVLGAVLLRFPIERFLENRGVYTFMYLAVAVSARYGGLGPGLLAVVLGGLTADFLYVDPPLTLFPQTVNAGVQLAIYGIVAAVISTLCESLRRSRFASERTFTSLQRLDELSRLQSERYRVLVTDVRQHAIIFIDLSGHITDWNAGATSILGWTAEEAIGEHLSLFFGAPDRAKGEPTRDLERATTGDTFNERWYRRRDGTEFWGTGSLTALRGPEGSVTGFAKILRDDTPRKLADAATQQARVLSERARLEAEALSRTKDEFLATVSHELRTPLNAISGWARLLNRSQRPDPARLAEGLSAIERNARAQAQLIEDILDVSRIADGRLRLERRPTDLAALVHDAVETIRSEAIEKGVTLLAEEGDSAGADVGGDAGTVAPFLADADRLRQVVWNLLSNAVKFTPRGGRVRVSVREHGAVARVIVADNGIGIAADLLPHVFDPFRQGDGSTTRRFGGLGLGLSIVRQLVEAHGGTVTVESAGPDQGSTFIVDLPRVDLPRIDLPRIDLPHDDLPSADPAHADLPRAEGATSSGDRSPGRSSLHGRHLLVVDDDADARELLRVALTAAGATVTSVQSVTEALRVLDQMPQPELALCDVAMPEADGYEFVRRVRQLENHSSRPRLPIVAVTAYSGVARHRTAAETRFDGYLPKPVDLDALLPVVSSLLNTR